MSATATKQNDDKTANQSNSENPSTEHGLLLGGVVATKPEAQTFTSKSGTTFHSLSFEVSDGNKTYPCKISSETGTDYPELKWLQPVHLRVLDARHDNYNGITFYVAP